MKRLFLSTPLTNVLQITGKEAHHLHVLRLERGKQLAVTGADGATGIAEVQDYGEGYVRLHLLSRTEVNTNEEGARIHLYMALLKGEKMDWVVQKATELGVTSIHPVITQNVIVHYDDRKAQARQEKWQKIARAAAEQCGRPHEPQIYPVQDVSTVRPQGTALFFYEAERAHGLKEILSTTIAQDFSLLIGPEGGFTKQEATELVTRGFQAISLGARILRAETAALAAMAIVQYERGDISPCQA